MPEHDHSSASAKTPKRPSPPRDLSPEARDWWLSVAADFELEDSHFKLLNLAARALGRAQQARDALKSGLSYADKRGILHPRPEIIIERQSSVLFSRLLRELRILNSEDSDDDARLPRNRGQRQRSNT